MHSQHLKVGRRAFVNTNMSTLSKGSSGVITAASGGVGLRFPGARSQPLSSPPVPSVSQALTSASGGCCSPYVYFGKPALHRNLQPDPSTPSGRPPGKGPGTPPHTQLQSKQGRVEPRGHFLGPALPGAPGASCHLQATHSNHLQAMPSHLPCSSSPTSSP